MSRPIPLSAALLAALLSATPLAAAETLRIATYDAGLSRDGPALLLYDLGREPKPDLAAALAVIRAARPDALLLTQFDHDLRGRALEAFRALLRSGPEGIDYPFFFDAAVNAGVPSGLDLDGDGLLLGWNDALGYGRFPGDGGMAILSRYPIDLAASRTFRHLLWADLPEAHLPVNPDGTPYLSAEIRALLPLSSRAHWDVVLDLPGGKLSLLASNPTPPLYDGPEGLNHLRSDDEIAFWSRYLDGAAFTDDQGRGAPMAARPFVLLGNLNVDPFDGAAGPRHSIRALLDHPRLRDPAQSSLGATAAARAQGGANIRQRGPAAEDTTDLRDTPGPGNLRLNYALPSRDLALRGGGVFWPAPGAPLADLVANGPAHRLVWVDVALP